MSEFWLGLWAGVSLGFVLQAIRYGRHLEARQRRVDRLVDEVEQLRRENLLLTLRLPPGEIFGNGNLEET